MTEFRTRSQWGARATRGNGNDIAAHPAGTAVHWEGPAMGSVAHSQCDGIVRSIQAYHQDSKGWADIAYSFVVCQHGVIHEGRGWKRGSAANGTTAANLAYYAVCGLTGKGDDTPPALVQGIKDACDMNRAHGAGHAIVGHLDLFATACPGPDLMAEVRKGTFGPHGKPIAPTSQAASAYPATEHPVVASGAPAFPLPRGWYFGPSTGPKASVSGYYGHSAELATWQRQMAKRGWRITADGRYGPQTATVAKAFQREKGLVADGLIGAQTWIAAWTATVTKG